MIRFTTVPEEANAVTHAGNFHADDIFSMILLEKFFKTMIVFRCISSMYEVHSFNDNVIIFDIGYGEFDHHQKNGNGYHPSETTSLKPIPYASFGLLWRKFGHTICDELTNNDSEKSAKLWDYIEYNFVLNIDAIDNGLYPQSPSKYDIFRAMTASNVISMLNHMVEEPIEQAINFAREVFDLVVKIGLDKINGDFNSFEKTKYFTAEQVFSYVLLKKIFPMKSNEELMNFEAWNYDNIKFHVNPYSQNTNSVEKQSIPAGIIGKIWEAEGIKYCSSILGEKNAEYASNFINSYLIVGIDAHANNILPAVNEEYAPYGILTVSDIIEALNPVNYSEEAFNNCWNIAVKYAQLIYNCVEAKVIDRIRSKVYVNQKIKESLKEIPKEKRKITDCSSHILIFDRHVHWQDWLSNSPDAKNIWFVISPSNKGGYMIQPVPCKYNQNGYRKGFPRKWYGLNGEQLRKVTKIPTVTFIHPKNGFVAGAEDLEGAVQLAKLAFANTECKRKI